jgi:O-antigen ligase
MNSALALLVGAAAALLQLAGALKTAPPMARLPFDLTVLALALLLPALALLLATRRWLLAPALALPLASAGLLWFWLVVAGAWSASSVVLGQKLPEAVALAPLMLVAGMVAGAEPLARRALCAVSLGIGVVLGGLVAWGALSGIALAIALDPEQARVHYQLAGLAMAMAAGLAAVQAVEARGAARLGWLALVAGLAVAALLPGGRTALLALGLGVALAPALRLWGAGRTGAALGWLGLCVAAALALALRLLLNPEEAEGLRTLERLTSDAAGLDARRGLWLAALDWAGREAPFGLGAGGFTIAAGHGERRGLYPHNHALEALAEAGLPGFVLWLGAFGGAALAAWRLAGQAGGARSARIAALVLPVALTVMVSTDLGNRMAWFALGLALSLGVAARPAAALGSLGGSLGGGVRRHV